MNKKNKRKQVRKILPVLLALVVMFSAFTVSAFADEYDDWDCDLNGHYISRYTFKGVEGECFAVCDICGIDLKLYAAVPYIPSFECGTEISNVSLATYDTRYEDGEYCIEATYFCSCDVTHSECNDVLFTPIVEEVPTESRGMIGSMVATLTDSLGGILTGVGASVVSFFDATVLTTNEAGETELTTFAIWALVFLGIGFGFGVVKFITNIVRKR